jgi:diamine N-acetyltransferase
MTLSIRPVTIDNWRALIELKVRKDQVNFVESNLLSIAEAQFGEDTEIGHLDCYPYGIYDDETPVGFLMYGLNIGSQKMQAFIERLMVDEKFQSRGYGKFGLEKMLAIFRANEHIRIVGISYNPANEVARRLYASYGFEEPGEMWYDETLALLKLRN